jgi:hypothetical protein
MVVVVVVVVVTDGVLDVGGCGCWEGSAVPPPVVADEGGGSSFLKNSSRLLCSCKNRKESMSRYY